MAKNPQRLCALPGTLPILSPGRFCPESLAMRGEQNPAQVISDDHRLGMLPGPPGGQARLPKTLPPPVASSPRDHCRHLVQALQPHGLAGGGPARAASSGGRLPAGTRPRHRADGLAARLAHLAADARGGRPAMGGRRAGHPVVRAALARSAPCRRPRDFGGRAPRERRLVSLGPVRSALEPIPTARPTPGQELGWHRARQGDQLPAVPRQKATRPGHSFRHGPELCSSRIQLREKRPHFQKKPVKMSIQRKALNFFWWLRLSEGRNEPFHPSMFSCFT